MSKTKYAILVEEAQQKLQYDRQIVFDSVELREAFNQNTYIGRLAYELDVINQHITVDPVLFEEAAQSYQEIGEHLVTKLHWSNEDISIIAQGSCRTRTLIRSPDASKFDIDAVCEVNISRIAANDPVGFFNKIGIALAKWEPTPKKRCWCIDFPNARYYIDFTPSIPLSLLPQQVITNIRYRPNLYAETALAVVDIPSKQWKTSNPVGFAQWVSNQAARRLLRISLREGMSLDSSTASRIESLLEQIVPLEDTLRIAIRLLKRHRDMSVRRGYVLSELRPISVIITTLLTQCYEGLADQGDNYTNPLKLLLDLIQLTPHMVENRNGIYWIENPTVAGENFAEKWNDTPALRKAFYAWCKLLVEDLEELISIKDEKKLSEKLREVFGCTGAAEVENRPNTGLASKTPSQVYAVPPTRGLA